MTNSLLARTICCIGSLVFLLPALLAQDVMRFKEQLRTAETFYEVMDVINTEYEALPENIREKGGQGYVKEKRLRRWEWYNSHFLNGKGEIADVYEIHEKESAKIARQEDLRGTESSWSSIGPDNTDCLSAPCYWPGIGRINRIAFHPTDADILYVGTAFGGVWKSDDGGASWVNIFDHSPAIGVSGIVVSHEDPDMIWVLTGDGDANSQSSLVNRFDAVSASDGVYKTIDGGNTWYQTGVLSGLPYFPYQIVQNSNNANLLMVATSAGLYKSTDYGETWTNKFVGNVQDVMYRPFGNRLYWVDQNNCYYSDTQAETWSTSAMNIDPPTGRKALASSRDDLTKLYLISGPVTDTGFYGGIYQSINSGVSFSRRSNAPNILGNSDNGMDARDQSSYDLCLAASHEDHTHLISGGYNAWRSTNAGVAWQIRSGDVESDADYLHDDVHDLEFNPLDDKLYAAHDGGLSVSEDEGATWTTLQADIRSTQSYHMDKDIDGSERFLLGNQDNGVQYSVSSGSATFGHISSGDGFATSIFRSDGSKGYVSINDNLYRFEDDGDTRTRLTPNDHVWFTPIEVHNTSFDDVVAGNGGRIWKSTDAGVTWTTIFNASASWALTTCPSNNDRLYSTGYTTWRDHPEGTAYRSDDFGSTWTEIGLNQPTFFDTIIRLTDIEVHPLNSNRVWVTNAGYVDGQKVMYSFNSGSTWLNASHNLPNVPVFCIAISSTNQVFVGTSLGVFYNSPGESDFVPFNNQLPNTVVTDLRIDESLGYIYASTFGRGVWKSPLPDDDCDDNITLVGNEGGTLFYEAGTNIGTTQTFIGSSENHITYKAGTRVRFSPGFKAEANSTLVAYIADCGEEGVRNSGIDHDHLTEVNRSSFDIIGSEGLRQVQVQIDLSRSYELRLLDENYQTIQIMHQGKLSSGQHTWDLDMTTVEANFLLLTQSGRRIYLQEL